MNANLIPIKAINKLTKNESRPVSRGTRESISN
jgi:hypothetical protein